MLATAEALEKLEESAEGARNTLNHLHDTVSEDEAAGISGLITNGNLYGLTGEGRDAMIKAMGNINQGTVISYLKNSLGKTEDELLTYFDVDSIEAVFEKFKKAWDNNEDALDDAAGGWIDSIQKWRDTNKDQLNKFTAASQTKIMNALTEAFTIGGTEGMNALGEVFAAAGDNADEL
jgi:hypothetical protein